MREIDRNQSVSSHALLKSLSRNCAAGSWVSVMPTDGESTPSVRPSTRGGWPLKANHFELGRPAIPTRKIGGVTGFRSGRQHRSIFRNGSWRQTLARRCSCLITVPPLNYPTILQSFVAARPTGSNFASFICNRRGCCLIERRYNRSQFKCVKFQRN